MCVREKRKERFTPLTQCEARRKDGMKLVWEKEREEIESDGKRREEDGEMKCRERQGDREIFKWKLRGSRVGIRGGLKG